MFIDLYLMYMFMNIMPEGVNTISIYLYTQLLSQYVLHILCHSRLGAMLTLKYDHQVIRNDEPWPYLSHLSTDTRDSISWLNSCDKSSYIRCVYSQWHLDLLKCTEPNINNQSITQVSQLYVHISLCLKVIRSWLNLHTSRSYDLFGWS